MAASHGVHVKSHGVAQPRSETSRCRVKPNRRRLEVGRLTAGHLEEELASSHGQNVINKIK